MRISDWSSDVCSSDLGPRNHVVWHPRAVGTDGCMVMKLRVDLQLRLSQRFDLKRVDIGLVKRRRLRRCGKWKQYVTAAALCEHIHHVRHDEIMAAHRAVARHLDFAFELAVRVEYPQTRIAVDEIGEHQVAVDNVQCGKHRSEEHTSELQSLMRISYAVFCLKKTTHSTDRPTSTRSYIIY